jgi:hypothetical protein
MGQRIPDQHRLRQVVDETRSIRHCATGRSAAQLDVVAIRRGEPKRRGSRHPFHELECDCNATQFRVD